MPRYAALLKNGLKSKGYQVEVWSPKAVARNLAIGSFLKKWLGYFDQYLLFPQALKNRIKKLPAETLFILTDQALGPFAKYLKGRPVAIHCHDFLAYKSARGEFSENKVSWTGKLYQNFIANGFKRGNYFISVSKATQNDLHKILERTPAISEVLYNCLFSAEKKIDRQYARSALAPQTTTMIHNGFLLHVGGNQWYKNRKGLIQLYNAWRSRFKTPLPLLMLGPSPTKGILDEINRSPFKNDIVVVENPNDKTVALAYQAATLLLFPSIAEGFGWPIAEAMSWGCPVITIEESPMNEVGGLAAVYLPKYESKQKEWYEKAAATIDVVVNMSMSEKEYLAALGMQNVQRFDSILFFNKLENIYQEVMKDFVSKRGIPK